MASEIAVIQSGFGKYTDRLPDEVLADDVRADLQSLNTRLEEIMTRDHEQLKSLARKSKAHLTILNKLEQSRSTLIKRSFVGYKEYARTNREPLGYLLSRWLICRLTLEHIPDLMLQELENVRQMHFEYSQPPSAGHNTRGSYIRFTRAYQAFLGCAVNILDIIEEYQDCFNAASKIMDPTYPFRGVSRSSWLFEHELITGIYELLLRANMGRFTCVPLIRSAIEVQLMRLFLDPPEGSNYLGARIIAIGRFDVIDFMRRYSSRLGISIRGLDIESLSRIYDWGSLALHRGWRMDHCQMWFAANIAEAIRGLIDIDVATFRDNFDVVIAEHVKANLVTVER